MRPAGPSPVSALRLHHCVSARSFRPLWLLEELDAAYTLAMWPFPPRVLARGFLDVNPLGTVPFLEHGETRMSESSAMCQYLARRLDPANRRGLAVAEDEAGYGAWLNWLHAGEATLTFPQTLVLRYGRFESPARRQPQVADDYARWFLSRLRGVATALEGQDWLCAGRFTAADISVGYALMLGEHIGLLPRYPVPVQDYWARLQGREGFRRAIAAEQAAALAQGVPTLPAPQALPGD